MLKPVLSILKAGFSVQLALVACSSSAYAASIPRSVPTPKRDTGAGFQIIRVQDDSPRVQYLPDVLANGQDICGGVPGKAECLNHWWVQHSLNDDDATHWTCGLGNSMSFTFQGSDISWFAAKGYFPNAFVNITVDNGPITTINQNSPVMLFRQQLFRQAGLDPTQNHTIKLTFAGPTVSTGANPTCMQSDFFEYYGVNEDVSTGNATMSSPPEAPLPVETKSGRSNIGLIVGCVIGSSLGTAIAIFGVLYYLRRRQPSSPPQRSPTPPTIAQYQYQSPPQPPTPPPVFANPDQPRPSIRITVPTLPPLPSLPHTRTHGIEPYALESEMSSAGLATSTYSHGRKGSVSSRIETFRNPSGTNVSETSMTPPSYYA